MTPEPVVREKRKGSGEAWLAEYDGSGKIYFDFNPELLKISHTASTEKIGSQSQASIDEAVRAAGITTINIDNIIFDGKGVKETCDQLLIWSYPIPNDSSKEKPDLVHLPLLKFMWGGSLIITATLHTTVVNYTRFTSRGTPTRAKVNLTLHQANVPRKSTNPSSGGLPGRRTHIMTGGECLPAVATASYGGPGNWRPLAEANHIDDPLRVRPGTIIFLPGPGELARPPAEPS